VHLPDLFTPVKTFDVGGSQLATLAPAQHLLHAAYTTVLGDSPPRLCALRDVVQILLVLRPEQSQVRELAQRWRAEAVLAQAVALAWETLTPQPRPSLVEWAQSYKARRMDRFLIASHVGRARAFTRHAAALVVVPGIAGRLSYLRAIAWPDSVYLRSRGFTRRDFALRALARLRAR
jgi:hypothetical protein